LHSVSIANDAPFPFDSEAKFVDLTGAAAAPGIALINTAGNFAGFAAGYTTGEFRDWTTNAATEKTQNQANYRASAPMGARS
jgi:membrane protein YqaA with SNARE-associated domain